MRRHPLLGTTALTMAAFAGSSAMADVTSADVWASYVSYYEATGAQIVGEPVADGSDMVVSDPALVYRLPFGIATIRIDLPEMRMTDQSDGTVILGFPEAFDLTVAVDVPDEGSGSGTFAVSQTGYSGVASGDPGNVTFTQSADSMKIEAKELIIPGEELDFAMQILSQGYSGSSTVTDGDLITVTSDFVLGAADVAYIVTGPDGDVISNTGQFGRTESQSEMALPAGGSNLFDMSAALKAGAFIRGTSVAEGSTSETITTFDNEVISEQSSVTGATDARFSIDAAGLDLFVEAATSSFKFLMPELFPAPIEASLGKTTMGYKFPLLPGEEAQDVALRIGLEDIAVSDALWDMLDPTAELPRDPATINIDLAATVLSEIDWLNFATLEAQLDQPMPPIAPETVTINDLTVSAVGASAKGSGAFTLDMTDMETIPGFPRPEGDAIVEVSGANTLIDRLTTLGFIGPDEAGMARLGMGFIARATGDDSFETVVEVNAEGHVLVNGQRMR